MISAERANLEASVKSSSLQIREKELHFFMSNMAVLATQSAFLSGLMFQALTIPDFKGVEEQFVPAFCYYNFSTLGLGFNVLTTLIASLTMIRAPGLAIRGPDGSMMSATTGMYEYRKIAVRTFWVGLVLALLTGLSLAWLKLGTRMPGVATSMTLSILVFLSLINYYGVKIYYSFRLPTTHRKIDRINLGQYDPEMGQIFENREKETDGASLINAGDRILEAGDKVKRLSRKVIEKKDSLRSDSVSSSVSVTAIDRSGSMTTGGDTAHRAIGLIDTTGNNIPDSVVIEMKAGKGNKVVKLSLDHVKDTTVLAKRLENVTNLQLMSSGKPGVFDSLKVDCQNQQPMVLKLTAPVKQG